MLKYFFLIILPVLFATSCTTIHLDSGKEVVEVTEVRNLRTTAYTHSEYGHRHYGRSNAIGGTLQSGHLSSAASDWSRFPLGTKLKVLSTGKNYIIDDYGSALVGSDTIDLYCPSKRSMHHWGVRHVDIEILEWGDSEKSLRILKGRTRHRHVRAMVADLEKGS